MDQFIGKKLDGRYQIESLIGVGGMANVYRAEDLRTQRTVAVKILREEFLQNAELVRRFKNESKAISILNHPNIVKVYDVSVTDRLNYIVMEYIDGITLKEYMKQRGGPLTWKEVVHFTQQILSALEHAHSQGVVHRDVKPQNIMLLANGSLKMMDFGIARFSREQSVTESDKAIGSVHYISPEQASGAATTQTTDLYSVGVIMYEMLTGRLPFDGEDAVKVAMRHITDKPPALHELAPEVPMALVQITEKAMAKNPANRYQSASEMSGAIQQFKKDPDISFEYQYIVEDAPERVISKVVRKTQGETNRRTASQAGKRPAAQAQHAASSGAESLAKHKPAQHRKGKKEFSLIPTLLGITLACVVVTVFACYHIFSSSSNVLFSNREDVVLADFVGMTRAQVEADPSYKDLKVVFDEEYDSNAEAGYVYSQMPKAGRTVKQGQKVTVKISLGTQYIAVPNVISLTQADAQKTLKESGLTVSMRPTYTTDLAVGTVADTDPTAGTEVPSGTTVTIYVAREKVETNRTVPNVTGLSLEDAKTALQNSGLIMGGQTEDYSDLPVGTVVQQSVAPDTEVRVNSAVDVVISKGPEPVEENDDEGDWGTREDGDYSDRPLWWFLPENERPKT